MLQNESAFYSAYTGYGDGSYFMVINASGNHLVTQAHDAPAGTAIIVRTIAGEGQERAQRWTFLDASGDLVLTRVERDVSYDHANGPGISGQPNLVRPYSQIGIDLTISEIADFIAGQKISDKGGIALLTGGGDVIAFSANMEGIIAQLHRGEIEVSQPDAAQTVRLGDTLVRGASWKLAANQKLIIVTSAPLDDFMAGVFEMRRHLK